MPGEPGWPLQRKTSWPDDKPTCAEGLQPLLYSWFHHVTVPIRNKNTRIAYYHAIGQFLDWCQRAGFRVLEDIEPITVAAYIEQHPGSPATIKQHMSAIRMLFSWLTEKGILAMNPAREVKTEKFSRREGKTPAFDADQVQKVLDKIDTSNEVGLRDRARC
jgi:integrase/recombinase XerD